jgi:hypothetical protein
MPPSPTTPPTAPIGASVRARYLQRWLKNVSLEEDPYRARFLASLPPEVRSAIDGAIPDAWLPMDDHVLLADLLREAFGPARAHEYYRRDFVASLRRPPFALLVRTGARMLGMTPAGFLRWAGVAYENIFRAAGSVRGEVLGPGHGRVVYRELPAVCTASDAWLDSAQGSLYGIYDFLGIMGVVRIDKSRRAEGCLELELEWTS